jgi:hypothetical protein
MSEKVDATAQKPGSKKGQFKCKPISSIYYAFSESPENEVMRMMHVPLIRISKSGQWEELSVEMDKSYLTPLL